MFHSLKLIVSLVCTFGMVSLACGQRVAIVDPEKAGPDFAVQGEYLEQVEEDQSPSYGAQVIALGDGKFELVLYTGGLPGAGWQRDDERQKAQGETKDDVTRFTISERTATIRNGRLTLADADDQKLAELKKLERNSPTLGAEPPEGATVLFDGSSAEKFRGAELVQENLLGVGGETEKKFGDHTLHIEFRTPFMPKARGQGRGNSGVYVQGRYEIQVLDSFGLEGRDNECGGIYSIAAPTVNMCSPPLAWQTFDYDFTAARYDDQGKKIKNARITIRHNGVVVHDDLELPHGTPGRYKEEPGPGPLYLQDHGDPVVFRNIWVVEKQK